MKHVNFEIVMESLCRIFLCLLLLFFYSTATLGNFPETIFSEANKNNDFSPFKENGKFGLKNNQGQILIPAQYDKLGWSDGSFSVVENVTGYLLNDSWGLINLHNHKITKADFLELCPGEGSVIVARKKLPNSIISKAGCLSTSGKVIIPFSYDGIEASSLRAIVYAKSGITYKHGLVDFENRVLIPLRYQSVYPLGSLRYAVVSFENKTAIFSDEGKQLTDFLIDSISSFKKNYAIIFQNQRQGLINRGGEVILEPSFRDVKIGDDGIVNTRKADAWLFLRGDNKLTQEYLADSVKAISSDLYKIQLNGKTQLADRTLKPLNGMLFSSLENFKDGKAVFMASGRAGMIRKTGAVLIEPDYDALVQDQNFVRACKRINGNIRWIIMDTLGKIVSQKNYENIGPYNGKYFPVKDKGYWGAVDKSGREIVACVHDSLIDTKENHIVVKFKGQYGIINTAEEWLVTPRGNPLKLIGNDRYLEWINPNQFLKSFKGDVIYFTPNPIELKDNFLLEYAPSGWINKVDMRGLVVDRFMQSEDIEKIFTEKEGYRAIKKDGRYGFIDDRARLRIANRYEDVKHFSEGLAAAKLLGKWGFISKEDKIVVQPVYDEVFSFQYGCAVVKQKNQFGLIDKKGKVLLPVRYDHIEVLPNKRVRITQNKLVGLADANGQIIINTKFDYVHDLDNGFIIVGRDQKFGVLSNQGISTIPMMYDGLVYDRFHDQFLALRKAQWQTADIK